MADQRQFWRFIETVESVVEEFLRLLRGLLKPQVDGPSIKGREFKTAWGWLPIVSLGGVLTAFVVISIATVKPDFETLIGLPILLVMIAGVNWPFVFLFFVIRIRARREVVSFLSAKTSAVCATLAMVTPNIVFLLAWHAQMRAPESAGDGAGLVLALVFVAVPIAGLVGYWLGEILGKCIMMVSRAVS